jgi:hypothetical protein
MLKLTEGMPVLQVEICIEGCIDQHWSEWFEGLAISYLEEKRTLLSGLVMDQTALYTLLSRLYRLGLPLVSVKTYPVVKEL